MPHSHPRWTSSMLRRDLSARALQVARAQRLLHDLCAGSDPAVIFGRDEQGRHGNFDPAAYQRICANPDWLRRLAKPHTASRRSRARKDWQWMELDSANSSDALLMSIFCHPGVFNGTRLAPAVAALLNVDTEIKLCFGVHPGVPLHLKPNSRATGLDRTEIDLTMTGETTTLFLEAKLTESDFQSAAHKLIERYRDFDTVFDTARLPLTIPAVPALPPNVDPDDPTNNLPSRKLPQPRIQGYQLIRNVLAAYASEASFCVLCDARRQDLIETWYSVLSAVHISDFAWHLKLLTWQELTAVLPNDLQQFLDVKYGIRP